MLWGYIRHFEVGIVAFSWYSRTFGSQKQDKEFTVKLGLSLCPWDSALGFQSLLETSAADGKRGWVRPLQVDKQVCAA